VNKEGSKKFHRLDKLKGITAKKYATIMHISQCVSWQFEYSENMLSNLINENQSVIN